MLPRTHTDAIVAWDESKPLEVFEVESEGESNSFRRMAQRALYCVFLVAFALIGTAHAQFLGYTSPQTGQAAVMNAITAPATTPTGSGATLCVGGTAALGATCEINNLGQNVHFLNYTYTSTNGVTLLDVRLEGSNDGVTFYPISEESINNCNIAGCGGSGSVFAVGYYAVIRANLISFTLPSGTATFTASYAGTSSTAGPLLGSYSTGQGSYKLVTASQVGTASINVNVVSPTGNMAGDLIIQCITPSCLSSAAGIVVSSTTFPGVGNSVVVSAPIGGLNTGMVIPVPPGFAEQVLVSIDGGFGGTGTYFAYMYFPAAGQLSLVSNPSIQSQRPLNTQLQSAANASVIYNIEGSFDVVLYRIDATCSAGTASLTVVDHTTQIWSNPSVGTTLYTTQWEHGLVSDTSFVGSPGFVITLGTCGSGNIGTLTVQASAVQ